MKYIASILVALAPVCSSNAQTSIAQIVPNTKVAAENTAKVSVALESGAVTCDEPERLGALSEISRLNGGAAQLQGMMHSRQSDAGSVYFAKKAFNEMFPLLTDMQFRLADAYLKRSCLDEADKVYRSMIATYGGSSYASIRQRAIIGIDDVRAARSTKSQLK